MQHQDATENVYRLLSAKLRGFFLSRTSDPQLADDLLQETFLRVHQRMDSVKDEQRLNAWVFQIARNLIIDHFRSTGRSIPSPQPEAQPAASAGRSSNLNETVASWLPAAMDALPGEYAQAVRLYELEGLSQQDVAERLGLSLSGAKSRIQRGRRKLKQVLEDCCRFQFDRRGNVLGWQPKDCGCDPD